MSFSHDGLDLDWQVLSVRAISELNRILAGLPWKVVKDQEPNRHGWVTFSHVNEKFPTAICINEKPSSGWVRTGDFDISEDGVVRAVIEGPYGIELVLYYRWFKKERTMPEIFFVETGQVDMQTYYALDLQPNQIPVRGFENRERFIFGSMKEVPEVLRKVGIARYNYFAKM